MRLPRLRLPDRRLATGVAIGALAGVLAVGAVTAAGPSAASTAVVRAPAQALGPMKPADLGPGLRALRNALRDNWRLDVSLSGEHGIHAWLLVRGTLTLGSGAITVTMPDDSSQAFAVTDATIVRTVRATVPFSTLKNGDHVLVFGPKNDDGTYTARVIRLLEEPPAQ